MKKFLLFAGLLLYLDLHAQLSVKCEELTTPEFLQAVSESKKAGVVPLWLVKKHNLSLLTFQ